jgi:hypothetical protein
MSRAIRPARVPVRAGDPKAFSPRLVNQGSAQQRYPARPACNRSRHSKFIKSRLTRIAVAIGFETFERPQFGWQLTLGPRIDREDPCFVHCGTIAVSCKHDRKTSTGMAVGWVNGIIVHCGQRCVGWSV